jgi:hypothetical protein
VIGRSNADPRLGFAVTEQGQIMATCLDGHQRFHRRLLTSFRVRPQAWSRRVRFGLAGAVATASLAAAMPTATAENDALAGWLSKAAVPVSTIHEVEGEVINIVFAKPRDLTKLEPVCPRLNDAKSALQSQLPSPDPALTAEIQQAVDNFEDAAQSCSSAVADNSEKQVSDAKSLLSYLRKAEQHLASADNIVAAIAAKH